MKSLKKLLIGVAGASILVAPAAFAAPYHGGFDGYGRHAQAASHGSERLVTRTVTRTSYEQPRRWNRGERFDERRARNFRVLSNPYAYRLSAAPRGYRWVQSDHDAVLVGITSGLIAAVMANALH